MPSPPVKSAMLYVSLRSMGSHGVHMTGSSDTAHTHRPLFSLSVH